MLAIPVNRARLRPALTSDEHLIRSLHHASRLLLGAGKIGRMIARFLMDSGDYDVLVGDVSDSALERIAKLTGADTRQRRCGQCRPIWRPRCRACRRSSRR